MSYKTNYNIKQFELGEELSAGQLVEIINNKAYLYEGITNFFGNKAIETWFDQPETVFNSAASIFISSVALDQSRVLIVYADVGNSDYATAMVLSINGVVITAGSEFVFNSAVSNLLSVSKLDSSRVVVSYLDVGNSNYGTAIVLSISNTTIISGSEFVFNSGATSNISSTYLDSTRIIVSYSDGGNSYYGTAIILSISGLVITAGSEFVFNSVSTSYISTTTLDSTRVLIGYRDNGNSNYGTAIALSINGTTITSGSEFVFNTGTTDYISVAKLSSSKVLVAYQDVSNSNYGTALVLSISNLTITSGTELVFDTRLITSIIATTLSSSSILLVYGDSGSIGTAIVLGIEGLVITVIFGSFIFNNAVTTNFSVSFINNSKVLVAYRDGGNSNYGTVRLLTRDISPLNRLEGILLENGNTGDTKKVNVKNVVIYQ